MSHGLCLVVLAPAGHGAPMRSRQLSARIISLLKPSSHPLPPASLRAAGEGRGEGVLGSVAEFARIRRTINRPTIYLPRNPTNTSTNVAIITNPTPIKPTVTTCSCHPAALSPAAVIG